MFCSTALSLEPSRQHGNNLWHYEKLQEKNSWGRKEIGRSWSTQGVGGVTCTKPLCRTVYHLPLVDRHAPSNRCCPNLPSCFQDSGASAARSCSRGSRFLWEHYCKVQFHSCMLVLGCSSTQLEQLALHTRLTLKEPSLHPSMTHEPGPG